VRRFGQHKIERVAYQAARILPGAGDDAIDLCAAESAHGDRSKRKDVVFQPGDGDAGAAGFVPDRLRGCVELVLSAGFDFRMFGKVFLRQDQETMIQQAEGLKHNPRLMLIDDADRPAKWFRAESELIESRRTGTPMVHPLDGPTTLRWRS